MRLVRIAHSWCICFLNAGHYLLFKLRLMKQPDFRNYPKHWEPWLGSLLGWPGSLRVRNADRCPQAGPAVFVSNHVKLDDPLFLWGAVDRASRGALHIYFMMRDDFFRGWPWDYLPFSMNELTASSGCIQISRDQISLSQLKPLLQVLESHEAFLMFPGRTRTRSGLCIEYREGIDEPGGVSFFLAHGSRRAKQAIPAAPLARTHNPVTGVSAVLFGEPRCLEPGADREAQRAFDFDLAVAVSNLTEIHALHTVSVLLYLHCLHGRAAGLDVNALVGKARAAQVAIQGQFPVDPEALEDPAGTVRAALRWLEEKGMIRLEGDALLPDVPAILAVPELDTRYRKTNPVKFYANEVLHYLPFIAAVEAQVLCGQPSVLVET